MSLRLLIDMNLSPEWAEWLASKGHDAVHWVEVGDPRASDREIMSYALQPRRIVFTHDLDFGATLALVHASGPSVLQVRGRSVLPQDLGSVVLAALQQYEADLLAGALLIIDQRRTRVRVLPLEIDRPRS